MYEKNTLPEPSVGSELERLDVRCASCGGNNVVGFYNADHVPVHSCLLIDQREDAIAYPHGEIRLGFCRECGFISNVAFDSSKIDYSPSYEETQHFSPKFLAYIEKIIQRLVDGYGIRNKSVLEIGCGKADFLAMLCEAGDNRGIGIDPACRPERISSDVDISIVLDCYGPKYSHLTADLICCRHTLEHIPATREFLQTLYQSVKSSDALLFFEVPDVKRILKERAFWDVYYEHCSYFSAGSLCRLFQQVGFEVVELQRDFDDQYLWLVARKPQRPSSAYADEDDIPELASDVLAFERDQVASVAYWKQVLESNALYSRRSVVWGASSKCVAFLSRLGVSTVEYVVDINPHKHGKYMPGTGQEIVSPDFLTDYQPDLVVVMNPIYLEEIRSDLTVRGVSPEILVV